MANVGKATTALFHDLDGDGVPEAVLPGSTPEVLSWRGERETGHGVVLQLSAALPNRDAIGARVTVMAEGRKQVREVGDASGLPGGPPGAVHVGVGEAVRADWVAVRWPDGTRQRFVDLPVDRRVWLTQNGHATWGEAAARRGIDRGPGNRAEPAAGRAAAPGTPPASSPVRSRAWTVPARLLALTAGDASGPRPLSHWAGARGTVVVFFDREPFGCETIAQVVGRHRGVAGVAVALGPGGDSNGDTRACALARVKPTPATRAAMLGGRMLLPLAAVFDASGRMVRLVSAPTEAQLTAALRSATGRPPGP